MLVVAKLCALIIMRYYLKSQKYVMSTKLLINQIHKNSSISKNIKKFNNSGSEKDFLMQ